MNLKSLFKLKKSASIGLSSCLFFLAINLAGSVRALLFENNNNLQNYIYIHNFMVLAGWATPIALTQLTKFGTKFTIVTACILLAIGNALSTYTSYPITLSMAGLLLGFGMSITNLAIRSVVFSLSEVADRKNAIANLSIQLQVSKCISGILGAALIAGIFFDRVSIVAILLTTSLISILIPLPIWNLKLTINKNDAAITLQNYLTTIKKHKLVVGFIVTHHLFAGLYLNIISPFSNVLLKRNGIEIPYVLLISALAALLGCGTQWYLSKNNYSEQYLSGFKITSLMLLANFFITIFLFGSKLGIVTCIIAYQILHATITYFVRFIELKVFHPTDAAIFYSLSHMIFLIGNMLGGSLGTYLFSYKLEKTAFIFCSIVLTFSFTATLFLIKKLVSHKLEPIST